MASPHLALQREGPVGARAQADPAHTAHADDGPPLRRGAVPDGRGGPDVPGDRAAGRHGRRRLDRHHRDARARVPARPSLPRGSGGAGAGARAGGMVRRAPRPGHPRPRAQRRAPRPSPAATARRPPRPTVHEAVPRCVGARVRRVDQPALRARPAGRGRARAGWCRGRVRPSRAGARRRRIPRRRLVHRRRPHRRLPLLLAAAAARGPEDRRPPPHAPRGVHGAVQAARGLRAGCSRCTAGTGGRARPKRSPSERQRELLRPRALPPGS